MVLTLLAVALCCTAHYSLGDALTLISRALEKNLQLLFKTILHHDALTLISRALEKNLQLLFKTILHHDALS